MMALPWHLAVIPHTVWDVGMKGVKEGCLAVLYHDDRRCCLWGGQVEVHRVAGGHLWRRP